MQGNHYTIMMPYTQYTPQWARGCLYRTFIVILLRCGWLVLICVCPVCALLAGGGRHLWPESGSSALHRANFAQQ